MIMEKDLELIDAYLRGELSGADLARFDEKLRNDVEFQSTFQEVKLIKTAIRQNLRANALQVLKDRESLIQEEYSTKNRNIMKRYLSIAASLVLVVSLVYLSFKNDLPEINGQAIFTENYRAYTNLELGTERGTNLGLEGLKQQAYYAYDLGNYAEAASDLTELVKSEKSAANYFYLGISNVEIGNSEAAYANFNTVINNFSEYKEQAQWYLALALIKEDKTDEAISNLVSLSFKGESYKEQSLKILKEKLGLAFLSTEHGAVVEVTLKPEEEDSPNGVDFEDRRQIQFGTAIDSRNNEYNFFNDLPIRGLATGDLVEMIVVSKGKKGKGRGFAVLLD